VTVGMEPKIAFLTVGESVHARDTCMYGKGQGARQEFGGRALALIYLPCIVSASLLHVKPRSLLFECASSPCDDSW